MKLRLIAAALLCALPLTACTLQDYMNCESDIYGEPEETQRRPEPAMALRTEPALTPRTDSEPMYRKEAEMPPVTEAAKDRTDPETELPADEFPGSLYETDSGNAQLLYAPLDGGIEISDFSPQPAPGSEAPLVIPAEIDGKPVTAVAAYGFANADYAHRLVLPDTVTRFGESAFNGSSLKAFRPAGAVEAESGCFMDCAQLTEIVFPAYPVTLGDYCFDDSAAAEISGTDCLLHAADCCFTDMPALAQITLRGDVTLGGNCFVRCTALEDVVLGGGSLAVGDLSFRNSALRSLTVEPCSSGVIGEWSFYECDRLETVVIGEGVSEIGDYAFKWCPKLRKVSLPESLSRIGEEVFEECSSVLKFEVPAGSFAEQFCKDRGFAYSVRN